MFIVHVFFFVLKLVSSIFYTYQVYIYIPIHTLDLLFFLFTSFSSVFCNFSLNADKTQLNGMLPLIRGYAQGNAKRKDIGALLIDPKEMGGAAMVELLETTILLTLSDVMEKRNNVESNETETEKKENEIDVMKSEEELKKSKYEDKKKDDVPPPPPPGGGRGYGGRPRREVRRVGGGGGNRKMIGRL